MKAIIENIEFEIEPAPDASGAGFAALLPLEVEMSDLNHNEKYYYTVARIPRKEYLPGHIECGDLMLWGSDCIVLFYKSFDNPFPYTRLGRVIDAERLGALLQDKPSVRVRFEK